MKQKPLNSWKLFSNTIRHIDRLPVPGLLLGIVFGFIAMMGKWLWPKFTADFLGSLVGAMISAGVALYIFGAERWKKNEEEEAKQKIIKKRIVYLISQLQIEPMIPAVKAGSFHGTKEEYLAFADSYTQRFNKYLDELDSYYKYVDSDEIDDYLEIMKICNDWRKNFNDLLFKGNYESILNQYEEFYNKIIRIGEQK